MPLVTRFASPGHLKDLDAIPGHADLWHDYIQSSIRAAISELTVDLKATETQGPATPQFYDASQDNFGPTLEQDIVWNAFPGELLRRFGREQAMRLADTLWPLTAYQLGWPYNPLFQLPSDDGLKNSTNGIDPDARDYRYRPQTEYCEWRTDRDEFGRVKRVTFTCEPPEYWRAMFGAALRASNIKFAGDQDAGLSLYRELVSQEVALADLLAQRTTSGPAGSAKDRYNPYNRWNSVDGIAHLAAPPNALRPEILLAALSTRLYKNSRDETVVVPDALCAGAGLGNGNRNSDVAIVAAVNALARQGRRVTLSDPLGVYMDHIDLAGWKFPVGFTSADCIRHVRGSASSTLRLVVEIPSAKFDVSDISIGGVPVRYGGQIAECITVRLRAAATVATGIRNERKSLGASGFVQRQGGSELFAEADGAPQGSVPALVHAVGRQPAGNERGGRPTAYPTREDLGEPLLELDQIQGVAIPGFLKPHQTLLCVRFRRGEHEIRKTKALLSDLLPLVTTARCALADRRSFQSGNATRQTLMGMAFTWPGLCSLTTTAEAMASQAFRQGMAARSALLGDPTQPGQPGHPSTWVVGGPGKTPHCVIVVAGDDRARVRSQAAVLSRRIRAAGCLVRRESGNKLEASGKSREHFGFVDGISQPGIRGRSDAGPGSFITPSRVVHWPGSGLYGYPGQELIWPGEFVLGYAKSGADPLLPGPIAEPELPWMRNGSYLVYNRLLQNVGAFWKTMREEAARLSHQDGFSEISAEGLASRLVGRTRNGVPVSRMQGPERGFHEGLGGNPYANNHFLFDSDTPRLRLTGGSDTYPSARADPLGLVCPLGAHIRKVNPRDGASDVGGGSSSHHHRILRVGVSFGPRRRNLEDDPVAPEPQRGQLFMCIQASIESQFEFLQARWMNDDKRPRSPGGHDMISGRTSSSDNVARRCTIFGAEGQAQEVRTGERFVTSSGGAYFFVPSIDAIGNVLTVSGEP